MACIYDTIPFMIAAMDMTYDYINRDMAGLRREDEKTGCLARSH